MFNYSILQVIELFPKYLLPPLNISIIIKTLETQLHLSLKFKKSPTIICSETPLYLIRSQCTTKMKSIWGFCIANYVKDPVPSTLEWRKNVNIYNFDFCCEFSGYIQMMYQLRNPGLFPFYQIQLSLIDRYIDRYFN